MTYTGFSRVSEIDDDKATLEDGRKDELACSRERQMLISTVHRLQE